jgi:hypothetical protein
VGLRGSPSLLFAVVLVKGKRSLTTLLSLTVLIATEN